MEFLKIEKYLNVVWCPSVFSLRIDVVSVSMRFNINKLYIWASQHICLTIYRTNLMSFLIMHSLRIQAFAVEGCSFQPLNLDKRWETTSRFRSLGENVCAWQERCFYGRNTLALWFWPQCRIWNFGLCSWVPVHSSTLILASASATNRLIEHFHTDCWHPSCMTCAV